jgi:hypothetical protein
MSGVLCLYSNTVGESKYLICELGTNGYRILRDEDGFPTSWLYVHGYSNECKMTLVPQPENISSLVVTLSLKDQPKNGTLKVSQKKTIGEDPSDVTIFNPMIIRTKEQCDLMKSINEQFKSVYILARIPSITIDQLQDFVSALTSQLNIILWLSGRGQTTEKTVKNAINTAVQVSLVEKLDNPMKYLYTLIGCGGYLNFLAGKGEMYTDESWSP